MMLARRCENCHYRQTPGMTNWAKWVLEEAFEGRDRGATALCDEQLRPVMIVAWGVFLGLDWAGWVSLHPACAPKWGACIQTALMRGAEARSKEKGMDG